MQIRTGGIEGTEWITPYPFSQRHETRNETRNETKRETKRNASAFTTLDMTATPAWGDYRGSSSVDSTGLQNPLNIVSIRFSTRILRVQSSVLGVQGAVELEALKDEGPDSYNRCYFREVFYKSCIIYPPTSNLNKCKTELVL